MDTSTGQSVSPTSTRDQRQDKPNEEPDKEDTTTQEDLAEIPNNRYQGSRRDSKDLEARNKEPSPVPSVRPGDEEEEMVEY